MTEAEAIALLFYTERLDINGLLAENDEYPVPLTKQEIADRYRKDNE